ncbi:HAMP domain-containing sensor histidine kinase [Luteimonas sp. MC1895]|uniref:histidine kinase dimerization/phospho-acceptor domain-containing protein n=1 Tax=Luteimonas sp. MC1895 TaxID=2819513 RepID=UPI0018F0C8E4|nr:HAMP domain-containing histidine kinase [Luteimonas sp. MC1895]
MPLDRTWLDRLAHDLRGPLSPIQTAVYLLRAPGVDAGQRDELLAVLDRQAQRLGAMIDEFSDLVQADRGGLVASQEVVDVGMLVADAIARLPARPPRVDFAPDAGQLEVEGDGRRLGQLFDALLGLQAARGCTTPVEARIERSATGLRMACTARCPDASDALAASLLESPHPDPPDGALGLGLVVASAIARAHGGRLLAHASGADALEFVLELPAVPG